MDTIKDFLPQAVVVDAGCFPRKDIAREWLAHCDRVVCCDGAANQYVETGYPLWRIVGDCDSLTPAIMKKYSEIIRRFPDQETNDQTKSVKYLAAKGLKRIVILGATGLREDHTLGNLSLLVDYLKEGIDARAYTDYGVFIPVTGVRKFYCPAGTQVSIFNFGASGLRSEGLKYPIRDFDNLWQGTLNETLDESFIIHATGSYMIFINYPA